MRYPQLATGALTQFPAQKLRRKRTVVNELPDGSTVKLADPAGEVTEWQLPYAGLLDEEMSALQQFFEAAEGSLQEFTFLDPLGNLFSRSDELAHIAWSKGPFLSVTGGAPDPWGGTSAWLVQNSGAAAQSLTQTLAAPGGYQYCLSAYIQAAVETPVTLLRGTDRADRIAKTDWSRATSAGRGNSNAESIEFGIEIPAGSAVTLCGLQVEPQGGASVYQQSTTGGVYAHTCFRDDSLSWTATDVQHHSVTVNLIHANRL